MNTFKLLVMLALMALSTQGFAGDVKNASSPEFMDPVDHYKEGLSYLLGTKGHEKSAEQAFSIFQDMAEQDYAPAQHMLGNLYQKGKGVEQDIVMAYKWFSLAANNGFRASWDKLMLLEHEMSQEQLSVAKNSRVALHQ